MSGLSEKGNDNRLSYRVLFYIVSCSLFFSIISASYRMYLDYHQGLQNVDRLVEQIRKSHLSSLSASLWDLDKLKMTVQLKGIMAMADIESITAYETVREKEEIFINIGENTAARSKSYRFPLEYSIGPQKKHIGTLAVVVSLDGIHDRIYKGFRFIVLSKLIEISLWSVFVLIIFQRLIIRHLNTMGSYINEFDFHDLSRSFPLNLNRKQKKHTDSLDKVASAINDLRNRLVEDIRKREKIETQLRTTNLAVEKQNRMKTDLAGLEDIMRGNKDIDPLTDDILAYLAQYADAQIGTFYIAGDDHTLLLSGRFAWGGSTKDNTVIPFGRGLVGQAAKAKKNILTSRLPKDYITVQSSLGKAVPENSLIIPILLHGDVRGVLELGSFNAFSQKHIEFIGLSSESIAVAIDASISRNKMKTLLETTQRQTEELENQQEELQATNEELEEQTQRLMASEGQLKQQQEELQVSNEELEEKTEFLERSKIQLEEKNRILERMQGELTQKAEDLALSSKYKSEFLANMSHELRTPLNSLLLLAKILSENKEKNLTDEQVESATIIFSSGSELLSLINEILDLSKIEAGKMELNVGDVTVSDLARNLEATFAHLAREKGLALKVALTPGCPASIRSDFERVKQILKNLMANALKFTSSGGIHVNFYRPETTVEYVGPNLGGKEILAVSVKDTGIGIAKENQSLIFEAFQQSEGGIARKYGGTGLGLSICRELSKLLGGKLHLDSTEGQGSTFTLYLPAGYDAGTQPADPLMSLDPKTGSPDRTAESPPEIPRIPEEPETHLPDDRDTIFGEEKSVLIIEDDLHFGKTLLKFCRKKGFLCLYSTTGENGLALARRYGPKAVLLDIRLPGMDGWAVFDSLKADAATRHIPIHFMSVEKPVFNVCNKGAVGYLTKPVSVENLESVVAKIEDLITKKVKSLLIVEDDPAIRQSICKLLDGRDIAIDETGSGKGALEKTALKAYDCMIMDLGLQDMSGFELLERFQDTPEIKLPPIIVYTGKELSFEEESTLRRYSESIIIKGVKSEERLLDETSLFLHRMVRDLPADQKQMITDIHHSDRMFDGKTVLLVDDDMRNLFALSKVLTQRNMTVLKAENGQKAVDVIQRNPDIDLVLMDIMMPVMDGYAAMKEIRKDPAHARLPIIALTAKAMKQDKKDCIQAGASDYLTKPVDVDRLLSLMRVWLYE